MAEKELQSPVNLNNKILTIVRDSFIREILEFNLQREGHVLEIIEDGRQASKLFRDHGRPRLVIMGLNIAYKNGHELLREMKKQEGWLGVPVLVLSRQGSEQEIEQTFKEGASDYVRVPFSLRELMARINRLLRPRA